MQATSSAFQTAVQGSHQSVCLVNVIQNGKVVSTLDVYDGSVSADRTAAQQRRFTASVGDPDGELTPADISSMLAPFGTRLQLFRGIRLASVATVSRLDHTVATWSEGTNNGTIADPTTGDLILGYV